MTCLHMLYMYIHFKLVYLYTICRKVWYHTNCLLNTATYIHGDVYVAMFLYLHPVGLSSFWNYEVGVFGTCQGK